MLKSSKITNRLFLLALVGLMVCMLAGPASALKPHVREGWLVGISYGYSEGNIEWGFVDEGAYKGGAVPQIRFGRMLGKKLALGVEYHGWMLEKGGVIDFEGEPFPLKVRSSLQSVTLAATWYPGNPGSALAGFYVRGGAGYGWAGFTVVKIDIDPPEHVPLEQEHGERKDESGLGFNFQLGYEFRLSRAFATGLGLGFDYLSINEDIYKSGYYFPITLTATWYWD